MFFSKPFLDASVSFITMQRFDIKNIIAIMVLNLYLTSGWSQSKWFCGGCALKLNYYNFNSSDDGFWKSDSVEYYTVRLTYGLHVLKMMNS